MENGRDAHPIRALNRHALEQIIAASSAGILVADAQNPQLAVVYVNPAYEKLTGYDSAELIGRPWALLARPAESEAGAEALRAAIQRGEACRARVTDLRKDGAALASEVSVTPLHNARGELRYFLCLQNMAAASAAEPPVRLGVAARAPEIALLEQESVRARPKVSPVERLDPASGLLRFAVFQDTLRRDLAMARRDRRFVSVLLLEIVELDVYEQTFGDKAAESCVRMIAAQIGRTLRRASDVAARYDAATLVAAVVGQEPAEIQPLADQIVANVRKLGLHNPRGKTARHVNVRATVVGCPPGVYEDVSAAIAEGLSGARGSDPKLRAVRA